MGEEGGEELHRIPKFLSKAVNRVDDSSTFCVENMKSRSGLEEKMSSVFDTLVLRHPSM